MLTGYRTETVSSWASVKTIFKVHNETGNIWTHLLSALYFVYLLADVTSINHASLKDVPMAGRIILAIQAFSGIVVFGFSTAFHIMENHCSSKKW